MAEINIRENYGKFKSLDILSVYYFVPYQPQTTQKHFLYEKLKKR